MCKDVSFRSPRLFAAFLFLSAILGFSGTAIALDCTPITSVPFTISAPGKYCLTSDLYAGQAPTAITVDADDVVLDLGGWTLRGIYDGGVTSESTNVAIYVTGQRNVTIRNGTISGFYAGIDFWASDSLAEGLSLKDIAYAGIVGRHPLRSVVRNNKIVTNSYLNPSVQSEKGIAFSRTTGVGGHGGRITDNTIVLNGSSIGDLNTAGIEINGMYDVMVDNNSVIGPYTSSPDFLRGYGIKALGAEGLQVTDNRITSFDTGVYFDQYTFSSVYRNNVVTRARTSYSGVTDGGNNF